VNKGNLAMCNQCHDSKREHGTAVHGRREVLMAGAALVTAPLLAGVATGTPAAQTGVPVGTHLAFYVGWPHAFSALLVAKDVFEKRPR
jgi:alkylhydroperoxidase/carboxymuconolactone decarboxylase family protein YurZ